MRSCAIFNPAAGRGRAARWLDELKHRLPPGTELLPTARVGHGIELAREATAKYDRIIAAGGDGTVHEVANGILLANRPETFFAVVPIGSANDYAFTLGISAWWKANKSWDELVPKTVDVGTVRAGDRERFFVNGLGIGFNGYVSNEARRIRWLRGIPLYTLAVVRTLFKHFTAPDVKLELDGLPSEVKALVLSFAVGQREGGFPLALAAKLDDGLLNWLHVADIRRWELIRHLPSMMTGNLPKDHQKLKFGQCRTARVNGDVPLCIHADGEMFALAEDGIRDVQIELLPSRLRVESWAAGKS